MIDIDASLQATESNPSFWVYFAEPGKKTDKPQDKIGFEVKADPHKQRRLIDRNLRISANYLNKDAGDMQITADWAGLAIGLTEYIIKWDGFVGEFNREKVKTWFEKYPSYAIAFAQQFKTILDDYEAELIKRKDAEAKN